MNNKNIEETAFQLEMLTETFIVLGEAVKYSESELPRNFLYIPVRELEKISDSLKENIT